MVYGVLLRPLPYPDSDRVAVIYLRFAPRDVERGTLSLADYLDWKTHNRAFEEPAAFTTGNRVDITGPGDPEQVPGAAVTPGFFSTLRVPPLLGRALNSGEDKPGSARVVVLSETLWARRFGRSQTALGRAIRLNGSQYTVIGVMPAAFQFPRPETELWTNLTVNPPTRRGPFFYRGIARLKPGVMFEQAQAETNAIGRGIEQANRNVYARVSMPVVPLRESLVGNARPALLVIFGAVILVLLIATVNVANLLLARANSREREMSIRFGLGATRARVLRQLLTESVLLALAGGAAGLVVAYLGIQALRAWNPGNLPRVEDIHLDAGVLGFTALLSLITGILFGLAPALQSSRGDLTAALRERAAGANARMGRQRTQGLLVISEIALSLMLLVGAGLLLRSFVALMQVNPGFTTSPRNLVAMRLSLNPAKYSSEQASLGFHERVLERARQLPGVQFAALSNTLPPNREADSDTFVIEGQSLETALTNPSVTVATVSGDYFKALGIPLLQGRYFDERDRLDSPRVTIISASMAMTYFPGRNPLGMRLKQSGPSLSQTPYMEIVGVAGDTKYVGLQGHNAAAYYLPYTQNMDKLYVVARSAVPAGSLTPMLRREVQQIDPEVVISDAGTIEQAISASVAAPRFRAFLVGVFAALALLLAAIGIYGVIAYSVAQRTHEIGVRMALGAQRRTVLRMILGQSATLLAIGIALGLAGSFALTRTLSALLFGVTATDPLTFAGVSLLLAFVALIASFIPAQRATRIDPVIALRWE